MHRPCLTGIYTIPVTPCNSRRKSTHIFSLALLTKHLLLCNSPSSKQVTYIPRYALRPLPLLAPHCCFSRCMTLRTRMIELTKIIRGSSLITFLRGFIKIQTKNTQKDSWQHKNSSIHISEAGKMWTPLKLTW